MISCILYILFLLLGLTIGYEFHLYGIFDGQTRKEGIKELFSDICNSLKRILTLPIRHKDSLSDAVKLLGKAKAFFEEQLNGTDILNCMINQTLILTDEEVIELNNRLKNHPYNTSTFYNSTLNEGIVRYEYRAIGVSEKYREISNDELFKMTFYIVRNYMMETRKIVAPIVIEVATPTRLCFAIALSEHGKKILFKNIQELRNTKTEDRLPVLEEEVIDLFPDSKDDNP